MTGFQLLADVTYPDPSTIVTLASTALVAVMAVKMGKWTFDIVGSFVRYLKGR